MRAPKRLMALKDRAIDPNLPAGRIPKVQGRVDRLTGRLTNRLGKLQGRLDNPGLRPNVTNRINKRIGRIQTALDYNPQAQQGVAPEVAPEAPNPYIEAEKTAKAAPADYSNALFPNVRAFEPENYEGSPMYKFQLQEGQRALDRLYASRGLVNSGAEIEGNQRFVTDLGAREADRAQKIAETEADRLERMQLQEANRLERVDNNNFDRMYSILQLMANQSPLELGYRGASDSASLKDSFGSNMANYYSQAYPNLTGGLPGPSNFTPPFVPPFPSQPNYGNVENSDIIADQGSSSDIADLFGLFSSFF